VVCGGGELAERERLPRDGEPQRRVIGGSLVRLVPCIARSNQIRWALQARRDLDVLSEMHEETDRSREGHLTATGLGRRRGRWSGGGSWEVRGGRLHHRGWRHVRRRGRVARALRVGVVVVALSAAEARKAAHLPFPSAPPRGGDPVDAGRAAWARASDEPMTRQGQECWARTHGPSRRPPSLRADHAPASQHRRGVSTSWNAMPELAARAPNETRPSGAEQGSVTRLVVGCSGDRRGARDHHEARTTVDGYGNGRQALEIERSKGLPRGRGDRRRTPIPVERRREERDAKFGAWSESRSAPKQGVGGTCRPRMCLNRAGNRGTAHDSASFAPAGCHCVFVFAGRHASPVVSTSN
jgi:hypothetical protein